MWNRQRAYPAVSVALMHAALAWALLQWAPSRESNEAAPSLTWVRLSMLPAPAVVEPLVEPLINQPGAAPSATTRRATAKRSTTHDRPRHDLPAPQSHRHEHVEGKHELPTQAPSADEASGQHIKMVEAQPAVATAAAFATPPTVASSPQKPQLQAAQHAHCPVARHPPALRERGIEGRVVVRVHVDAQGRADEVQLVDGSGWRQFDTAALANALDCRFLPARRDGQPVDSWVEFTVRFTLRD